MYVYIHIYICVCVCVCVYIYIYIYIYIFKPGMHLVSKNCFCLGSQYVCLYVWLLITSGMIQTLYD